MARRKISIASIAVVCVVASQTAASAAISRYIDGPRNEFNVAVETGVHAWAVDTAAHPYADTVWVKPDGGPAYRVSALTSAAYLGNIDLANPTYGDVLVFYSGRSLGRRQFDIRLWDLANHAALALPDGINTPTADERQPSISGDYLLFQRVRPSGATRLLLYRFSTQAFTTIIATSAHDAHRVLDARLNGDYVVYDSCSSTSCDVFRRQISTTTTVKAPNSGHANYWPTVMPDGTVYYVQGSARFCGHHTRLMRWPGSGSATLLAALPETIEAGGMDAYDDGVSTTLYFTRIRCRTAQYGIYRLTNA